jgi:hypothetical protein
VGALFAFIGLALGMRKRRQPRLFLIVIFAAVCFIVLSLNWR